MHTKNFKVFAQVGTYVLNALQKVFVSKNHSMQQSFLQKSYTNNNETKPLMAQKHYSLLKSVNEKKSALTYRGRSSNGRARA